MTEHNWHRNSRTLRSLVSAAVWLAAGSAAAQVPITKVIVVQPIDVCSSTGTLCAPFNTTSPIGHPTTQNSTTNPIGFVYSYTNPATETKVYIDVTRALLNQIGIDVAWNKMVQYNSPVINTSTEQTYQTLNVVTDNSACGLAGAPATGLQSCDFLNLSQQAGISQGVAPNPTFPNAPVSTTPSVLNMFFVTKLNPPASEAGSQLYDFSWVDDNGVSIGANTFFPPAPLTPFLSVIAHGIGHNLGWDHTTFGAGPYDPYNSVTNPDGGVVPPLPASPTIGECDANYPACMANLMTAGNLRTEPTVNCVVVANPPLAGETACSSTAPSLTNGTADQITTTAVPTSDLPVSQEAAVFDPSGFLQPIADSTTTLNVAQNSMTVNVTGASNGGPKETLLAWVLTLPSGLQFNNQFHIISQSRSALLQDVDFPHPDNDNTANGVYNLGTLYDICAASGTQCLILEFNLPGAGATDQITFSKGFKSSITAADLCGADVTSVFAHGYLTTGQLACSSNSPVLTANSWSPDLTAPAAPQIVNPTAFATAAANNPSCSPDPVTGMCPDPTQEGVEDANPADNPQICYSGGVPVPC